jgi:hypothetical protein
VKNIVLSWRLLHKPPDLLTAREGSVVCTSCVEPDWYVFFLLAVARAHWQGEQKWLHELIKHKEWRQLIYQLSETHKGSLMLNYIMKLISKAGTFVHSCSALHVGDCHAFRQLLSSPASAWLAPFCIYFPRNERCLRTPCLDCFGMLSADRSCRWCTRVHY